MEHKLSLDQVLEMINEEGELAFRIKDIESYMEFTTATEKGSIENVLFKLTGHSPVMEYNFDEKKLSYWCESNNLSFNIVRAERAIYFRKNEFLDYKPKMRNLKEVLEKISSESVLTENEAQEIMYRAHLCCQEDIDFSVPIIIDFANKGLSHWEIIDIVMMHVETDRIKNNRSSK